MKRSLPSFLALLALSLTSAADPVGPAFTYQGRLDHNGAPASGSFDLKFELFDAAVDGNAVGVPIELPAQVISSGLFATELDFGGPLVFDGTAYWLAVSAKEAGAADYVAVPGRTAIRPAPYAIHALSAATVKDGSITGSSLADGAVTGSKLSAGAVGLAQLSAPGGPIAGQVLGFDGADLSWIDAAAGGGGSGPWLLSGTSAFYSAGNVGIGTSVPASALEVNGIARSTRSNVATQYLQMNGGDSGSIKLTAQSAAAAEKNLYIQNLSGEAAPGVNNNIQFELGTAAAPSTKMTLNASGNLGIGTISPQARLHLYHPASVSQRIEAGGGTNAPAKVEFANGNGQWNIGTSRNFNGDQFYIHRQGAAVIAFAVQPNGDTVSQGSMSCKVLTIRGGADLAEPFAMSHSGVEPGSVVVIDEANPGKLKASTHAYDKKVAGIVSGANGIRPGISMTQEDKLEAGENVALSGRVYVKADTGAGAIEPGDLLTTSSTAGRAMKAADHSRAQGAIIGKAMTRLDGGDGMVLVLVTLQ